MPHISAIVTFHSEGQIAELTLRGMQKVREHAAGHGLEVEFVAVLDCADIETRDVVRQSADIAPSDQILEVSNRDLGASRNSGVAAARGDYIGIFDGDDYYSDNWLANAYRTASSDPRRRVVHPEYQVSFGATHCVARLLDMEEEPAYPLQNCLAVHPWIACSFGHRSLYERHPYVRSDTARTGFGFEDWHWNLEVLAGGARHVNAPGSAHYYRRKTSSMLTEMVAAGALIRPNAFFDFPSRWTSSGEAPPPQAKHQPNDEGTTLLPDWVVEDLQGLAAMAPELTPTPQLLSQFSTYAPGYQLAAGELYRQTHGLSGGKADIILIADSLQCTENPPQAVGLARGEAARGKRVLMILTEDSAGAADIPAEFKTLEFGSVSGPFDQGSRLLVLTRLLLQSGAEQIELLGSELAWSAVQRHGKSLVAVGQRIRLWEQDASGPDADPIDLTEGLRTSGECGSLLASRRPEDLSRTELPSAASVGQPSTGRALFRSAKQVWSTVFKRR